MPAITSPFARYLGPRYRGMLAADITAFGRRDPRLGLLAREVLYRVVEDACYAAGIDWSTCYHEDRGDGLVLLVPADKSVETLIDPLVGHIRAGLSCYNTFLASNARIQLRIAIHAGHVFTDARGISGDAVNHLFRLLQAPAFKARISHCNGEVAVIASDHYYREIITYSPGQISADSFQPIAVNVKETSSSAWVCLPSQLPRKVGHNKRDRMIPPTRCPGSTPASRASRTLPGTRQRHSSRNKLAVPGTDDRTGLSQLPGAAGRHAEGAAYVVSCRVVQDRVRHAHCRCPCTMQGGQRMPAGACVLSACLVMGESAGRLLKGGIHGLRTGICIWSGESSKIAGLWRWCPAAPPGRRPRGAFTRRLSARRLSAPGPRSRGSEQNAVVLGHRSRGGDR